MPEVSEATKAVIAELACERQRQIECAHGGNTEEFDRSNTQNDWIAFIAAYTGRAADRCARNIQEGHAFRSNMIKAGAVIIAAIEAYDKGHCR